MRLTPLQIQRIKNTTHRIFGDSSRVWLFGSRVDNDKRGGDIDLMVEVDEIFPNRAEAICSLYGALIMALGDRKLDIVLKDGRTKEQPIFEIARRTGVLL